MVKIAVAGGTGRESLHIQITFQIPLTFIYRSCPGNYIRLGSSEETRYNYLKPQCKAPPGSCQAPLLLTYIIRPPP